MGEPALHAHGTWVYRRLLWEAGAIGQALYIAAEGLCKHGTGHGAYFGGLAHDVLGVDAKKMQDVYHFIIGTGVPDLRKRCHLMTTFHITDLSRIVMPSTLPMHLQ